MPKLHKHYRKDVPFNLVCVKTSDCTDSFLCEIWELYKTHKIKNRFAKYSLVKFEENLFLYLKFSDQHTIKRQYHKLYSHMTVSA